MKVIGLDTETTGGNPYLDELLITTVVTDSGEEHLFRGLDVPPWVLGVIEDPDIIKVMHNASFDLKFLKKNFGVNANNVHDSLGIERLLTAGLAMDCDLATTLDRRFSIKLDKSHRRNLMMGIVGPSELEYAMNDTRPLIKLYETQMEEVKRLKQDFAAHLENNMSLIVADMELTGIPFDIALWESYQPTIYSHLSELRRVVYDDLGISYSIDFFTGGISSSVSLGSHQKVLMMLEKIGIRLKDYTSETLQAYYAEHPDSEVIKHLLEFKKWDKISSWDVRKFINPITGKIHGNFNAQGTDTFRYSSKDPNLLAVMQPYEDIDLRHLFIAGLDENGEENSYLGADYSQVELRILADVTEEPLYVEAFLQDKDMHEAMGEILLGRPVKNKQERTMGKVANFGIVAYGGGPGALIGTGLSYGLYIPQAEAKQHVNTIRAKNTRIERWGKVVFNQMIRDGFIQTPIGHLRWLKNEDRETVARNTNIQMYAAGVIKSGMVPLYFELREKYPDAHIVLQVHDELGIICPKKDAEAVRDLTINQMEAAGNRWTRKVPIKANSYISKSWEK